MNDEGGDVLNFGLCGENISIVQRNLLLLMVQNLCLFMGERDENRRMKGKDAKAEMKGDRNLVFGVHAFL